MAISLEKPKSPPASSIEDVIKNLHEQSSEGAVNPIIRKEDLKVIRELGGSCIDVFKAKRIRLLSRTYDEYWVVGSLPTEGEFDG